MSAPTPQAIDNGVSLYAPKWAQEAELGFAPAEVLGSDDDREPQSPQDPASFEGDIAMARYRTRPSLEPEYLSSPPPPIELYRRSFFEAAGKPLLMVLAAASIAVVAVARFPASDGFTAGSRKGAELASLVSIPIPPAPAQVVPPVVAQTEQPRPHLQLIAAVPETPAAAADRAPAPEPPAVDTPPARQLDAEEIATLRKRGEDFLATGDIAAARLMFQRAAEGRDARSAMALAATYDPLVLAKLKVRGFAPDIAQARAWYERAKELGSLDARTRLDQLASEAR